MTITLRPSDKTELTCTQARASTPLLGAVSTRSPHSLNCQTTPAPGPTTFTIQSEKGSLGNSASKSDARARCVLDTACISMDWAGSLFTLRGSAMRVVTEL